MTLFFSSRLRCSECHGGFNLSGPADFDVAKTHPAPAFHNTGLYDVDRADLLAFLDSLTDRVFLADPALARPR